MVERELPKINVKVLVYPKYETRGDLGECVSRFRDWYVPSTYLQATVSRMLTTTPQAA